MECRGRLGHITGGIMTQMQFEIIVLFAIFLIIGELINIAHFCKGIKRDLYQIITGKKFRDSDYI